MCPQVGLIENAVGKERAARTKKERAVGFSVETDQTKFVLLNQLLKCRLMEMEAKQKVIRIMY